ncbi:hypothetical protein WG66_017029 [Moniliophthora roreri]|nr:hypothetical protein WG66_017029 [Moniliophthora roreri]
MTGGTSKMMASSLNSLDGPSSNPEESHIVGSEYEWRVGSLSEWYKGLTTAQTSVDRLQIRKEAKTDDIPHWFVVLYMQDRSIYRFERRESQNQSLRKVDEKTMQEVDQQTELEIELFLDGKVDLGALLATCFAISRDDSAKDHSQTTYHSLFFSWTILMVAARHCMPYEVPPPDSLRKRASERHYLPLTNYIVNQATDLFLTIVVETIAVFRNKSGAAVYQGLDPFTRATWALPNNVLRFICRRAFRTRLQFGLRKQLERQISEVLGIKASEVLDEALKRHPDSNAVLNNHMWLKDLDKAVEPVLRAEVVKVLWSTIFDAICGGYGDIDRPTLVRGATHSNLKFTFILGQRLPQYYAVWNAALHGGLCGARVRTEEEDRGNEGIEPDPSDAYVTGLNNKMFDLAWKAASDGAFKEAQAVVKLTQEQLRPRLREKRELMWNDVWRIWPDVWAEAQSITQQKSVDCVDRIMKRVLETGVKVFKEEMSESSTRSIGARIGTNKSDKRKKSRSTPGESVSNGVLQELMDGIMKREKVNSRQAALMNEALSRIWTESRRLPPLAKA